MTVIRGGSGRTDIKHHAFPWRKGDASAPALWQTRQLAGPRGCGTAGSPERIQGGSTAITSIRTHRLLAALPLAAGLLSGAALAAGTPPTPAPRPDDSRAVDGGVRRSLSEVPRPQQSPDRAPTPPGRPDAGAADTDTAPVPAADPPPPAPPAPPPDGEAPPEPRAPEPVARETGPIGPPAPGRTGPDNAPLPRPDYQPGPRPPLDDRDVAARDAFGPPSPNPLMADRVCQFSPSAHAVFTLKPEIETDEGCGVVNPVRLESVGDDPKISFVDPPVFSCAFANALADILVGDVQTLAMKHLDSAVVEVGPGTSYACRGRNNDEHAKLSEHAFGNAFDLQALRLADGTFLTVVGGWTTSGREKDFWREFQNTACRRFKTVLGPNANKLHYDHFHLDMARRKRGYAICQ